MIPYKVESHTATDSVSSDVMNDHGSFFRAHFRVGINAPFQHSTQYDDSSIYYSIGKCNLSLIYLPRKNPGLSRTSHGVEINSFLIFALALLVKFVNKVPFLQSSFADGCTHHSSLQFNWNSVEKKIHKYQIFHLKMDKMWLLELIVIFRPLLENIHRVTDTLFILERTSGAHN